MIVTANYAHKCCGTLPQFGYHSYHKYGGRENLPGYGYYCDLCKRSVSVIGGARFALAQWNLAVPRAVDQTYISGAFRVSIPQWGSMYEGVLDVVVIEDLKSVDLEWLAGRKDWNMGHILESVVLLNPFTGATITAPVTLHYEWDNPKRLNIHCYGYRSRKSSTKLVAALKEFLT